MEHVQIPLIDIARDEDVERLRLANERRAIGGEVDDPALIDFERRLEDVLLIVAQPIEMMHRAGISRMACGRDKSFVLQMEAGDVIEVAAPNVPDQATAEGKL